MHYHIWRWKTIQMEPNIIHIYSLTVIQQLPVFFGRLAYIKFDVIKFLDNHFISFISEKYKDKYNGFNFTKEKNLDTVETVIFISSQISYLHHFYLYEILQYFLIHHYIELVMCNLDY